MRIHPRPKEKSEVDNFCSLIKSMRLQTKQSIKIQLKEKYKMLWLKNVEYVLQGGS